jgi:hypothetical protein
MSGLVGLCRAFPTRHLPTPKAPKIIVIAFMHSLQAHAMIELQLKSASSGIKNPC